MNSLNWKPQISMGGEMKGTLKFSLYLNCNSHPIYHIIMYHNMYVLYVYYMYIICHGENEDMHFRATDTWTASGNKWRQPLPLLPLPVGLPMCDSRCIKPLSASSSWSGEPSQWQVISLLAKLQNCRCFLLTVNSEQRLRCGSVWVISRQEVVWPPWGGLLKVWDHCCLGSPWQSLQWGLKTRNGEGGGISGGREGGRRESLRNLNSRKRAPSLLLSTESELWGKDKRSMGNSVAGPTAAYSQRHGARTEK